MGKTGHAKQLGQSVVEFALAVPVLFFFVFGAFVVETIMADEMTAGYAVRQGARLSAELGGSQTNPGATQAQIDAKIVRNVLAVTRTMSSATISEIDIYAVTAADGTLQSTDFQDQFNGSGAALAKQTFTLDKRIQTPPNETSIGVRLVWSYLPPGGSGFAAFNAVNRAVMKASPVLV
jgi:Flp pilus assembly protein TadG